jgi:hypothetical protein
MNMKRFDPRLWIGVLMVFGGVLILLDNLNIISDVSDIFWGVIWGLVGLFFLYLLFNDRKNNWWAAFPAFTLLGLAASSLLPDSLEAFDSLVFFGFLSFAFWWVYFSDMSNWWAIIPGGVLLTLGVISVLDEISGVDNGGFLFLGLGLTFILVAILPGGRERSWAFIPGVVLLIFGSILGTPAVGLLEYLWPAVLIILGGYFVLRFFRNQPTQ